jgi:hypothetical protein
MTRNIILAAVVAIATLAITPLAEAKKGGGGNWKGPPPHGNAWGHYKNAGWPGYWYGGYPYYAPYPYPPPPVYYGPPARAFGYPASYGPILPAPEALPPPAPAPSY